MIQQKENFYTMVLEIKRPGREADDLTPTSAEDMRKWSPASKPLIRPHGTHSDFTFSSIYVPKK